ncbi:nucleotide exchange factor GrpE [Alteriqipengyuania flavescens]|uniref:nucleotide exchange factor GrpE n=1 Tax=Alteriqipengyuania flavescens TaxID=3053610 RepID=UPI0025B4D86E|nr:nucleotide exchange factor GrpE [Alteriqipengyuania flavescens]WJY18264.1 nucleotide exchange factor GrpE [Alteriqipengyuania flavescens]WJY24205.1 nucleotide exchange factor GrpE [Alteriqipengyuania flavescens]
MDDTKREHEDPAVAEELAGVPEEMLDTASDGSDNDAGDSASELAALREELEAAKQDVLYARADTQNVRRRLEKDIQDARAYGATGFARDILSVADNLDRAIQSIPEDLREDSKFKGLVTGIQATQRELEKVFGQNGITRIAAMGLPLDPNQHQAMMEVPTDDAEEGTIVQEMQAGYMIKDRLLRPAMVGVAKKPG